MQNPFSTTFSRFPENTYISTLGEGEIIENFSYDNPAEAVYKITGVRGSGKTVILARVQDEFKSEENAKKGWLVYTLNPARDMLAQLAASLYSEDFIKEVYQSRSVTVSASVLGTGGSLGYSAEKSSDYFDVGVEIKKMLEIAQKKKKKILLCVDEVSKTPAMLVFALEFGGWLIAGYPVYLVCTGLFENVQELGNVKNLTFFRRGTPIETQPLNLIKMAEIYRTKLRIEGSLAKEMANLTMGYAYAFQELGSLYFKKKDEDTLEDVVDRLKAELFSYSYEKIWEELSPEDKGLCLLLKDRPESKREDILPLMGEKAGNYSVYRDRLLKRGVIRKGLHGYVLFNLPFFAEYIDEYGIVL